MQSRHTLLSSSIVIALVVLVVSVAAYSLLKKSSAEHFILDTTVVSVKPAPANGPEPEQKMSVFEKNECKPECCGSSEFSCSHGCICKTKEQERLLNTRGYNRAKQCNSDFEW